MLAIAADMFHGNRFLWIGTSFPAISGASIVMTAPVPHANLSRFGSSRRGAAISRPA